MAQPSNQSKFKTDISEFNVAGQKLYLLACMELNNGEIIAHRMAYIGQDPLYNICRLCLRRDVVGSGLARGSDLGILLAQNAELLMKAQVVREPVPLRNLR